MSYYSQQPGQQTSGNYPYSSYPNAGAYTQNGVYSYPSSTYSTSGYGSWSYYHQYYQQMQQRNAAGSSTTPTTSATGTTQNTTTATSSTPAEASVSTTPAATQKTTLSSLPSSTGYTPRETVTAAATGGATGRGAYKKQAPYRGLFTKELRNLMYAFGDDRNPANDTVNVMEEILVEYITDICQVALSPTKKNRLAVEDFRRALSRPEDAKKLARMEELLFMQEVIKRARKQFPEGESAGQAMQGDL